MHIQYTTNIDEVIDAHVRSVKYFKTARTSKINGMVVSAIFCALLSYIGFSNAAPTTRIIACVIGACVGAIISFLMYPGVIWRRMSALVRESIGDTFDKLVEVEIRESGLWIKCDNTESEIAWDRVLSVKNNPNDIEIRAADGGILLVQNRGFKSSVERDEFLAFTRQRSTSLA
ncbi:MAG: hypothetical protein Q7T69_00840 [Rhodoferax sp.]|nr:hypothetical protein [Rhodoferax sp.]